MGIYIRILCQLPRSNITNSINGRIRTKYGRLRLYFVALHVTVLRSCISVTVNGGIRRKSEHNEDSIRPCLFDLGIMLSFTYMSNIYRDVYVKSELSEGENITAVAVPSHSPDTRTFLEIQVI